MSNARLKRLPIGPVLIVQQSIVRSGVTRSRPNPITGPNWRFSIDNLVAVNDRVVSAMDTMELPNIYRRSSGRLHTSSDGQKFEIRAESLNANYSFKYFGKGRGVSAYTFIDERNLLWYSLVFSASERESAYVAPSEGFFAQPR